MDEETEIPQTAIWMIEEMRKYIRLEMEAQEFETMTWDRIVEIGTKMVNLSLFILEYYPNIAFDDHGLPCPPAGV